MTDLKFPANNKRKDNDFTVPLGDILARNGRSQKNRQAESMREFVVSLLYKLTVFFLITLALYLLAGIFLDHANAQVKYQEVKMESLRSGCEEAARV